MASMSYCVFENTSTDLAQCIGALQEAVENGTSTAQFTRELSSSYERSAFQHMRSMCAEFVELCNQMDEIAETDEQEEDDE